MQYVLSRARGGRTTFSRSPFFWTLVMRRTSEKSRATTSSCVPGEEKKIRELQKIMTTTFFRDRLKWPVTGQNVFSHLAVFSPSNLQVFFQQQLTYNFGTYSPDWACEVKLANVSDILSRTHVMSHEDQRNKTK